MITFALGGVYNKLGCPLKFILLSSIEKSKLSYDFGDIHCTLMGQTGTVAEPNYPHHQLYSD